MEYLFHYTKSENALKIISDKTLLFNNINKTNDPYENKIFDMHIKPPDNTFEDYEGIQYFEDSEDNEESEDDEALEDFENFDDEDIEDFLPTDDRVSSNYEEMEYSEEREEKFIRDSERRINNIKEDYMPIYFQQLNNLKNGIVKTISFSTGTYYLDGIYNKGRTGYLYPRMWAQYGNNSTGVCVVFKKDELLKKVTKELKNDYDIFYGNIDYVDIFDNKHALEINNLIKARNHIVFRDYKGDKREPLVENIKNNYKLYFFRKDKDWSGENEYRILILNKKHNNDFEEKIISLNISCIKAVFFGENADIKKDYTNNKNISLLMEACRHKIVMYKLERDFHKGKYILKKI